MIPKKIRDIKTVNRLTNNPVENYFGFLKNSLLENEKKFPSELVQLMCRRLLSKYKEYQEFTDFKTGIFFNLLIYFVL